MKTNCPNCGAPIEPISSKCPYCDTPYTLKLLETFVGPAEVRPILYADDKPIEYAKLIESGVMTPNEARELVGLPKLSEASVNMGITCKNAEKAIFDFANAFKKAVK